MPVIRIVRPPMLTKEIYDAVNAEAGVDSEPPEGLLIHTAGEVDGVFQVVDVWESPQAAERFDSERLGPAIAKVVGVEASAPPAGAPVPVVYDLHSVIQP